jgi:hypothetical protein
MAVKQHQQEHKHDRYYIFTHLKGDAIEYVAQNVGWVIDIAKAKLYPTLSGAKSYAACIRENNWHLKNTERTVCIGKVKVAVDGYWMPVVVDKK